MQTVLLERAKRMQAHYKRKNSIKHPVEHSVKSLLTVIPALRGAAGKLVRPLAAPWLHGMQVAGGEGGHVPRDTLDAVCQSI